MLTRLQHIHPQPDMHELTQHTKTIHNLRALAQKHLDYEIIELSYLLEISHSLKHNIPSPNVDSLLSLGIDTLLALAAELSSKNPLRQNHKQLSLMRMLLHVLHLMRLGDGHAALAKLKEHHQLMDSVIGSDVKIWDKEGKFDLLICNGESKLWFEWFTQSEAFVFGYILSGAVYFSDSSEKTLNFFTEGIRVADSTSPLLLGFELTVAILGKETYDTKSWLSEVTTRRDRLLRLKRYSLLYSAFAALLRSQWDVVLRVTSQLHDCNEKYFSNTTTADDTAFMYLYKLLIAIRNHYTGQLGVALQLYSDIPVQAGETYLLALLNKSLILRGGSQQDQSKAIKCLDEVERRLFASQHPYPQLRDALYLLRGITSNEVLRSKFPPIPKMLLTCRELLSHVIHSAAIHLNSRLRFMALTITMARFYINTSTEHAEKLGLMAYIGAQKSRDQLWQLVDGNLLAGLPLLSYVKTDVLEVYMKQDKHLKKARQDALNEEHRQAAAIPFNLPGTS